MGAALAVVGGMLTARAALAEFVGGVEQFNGTVKDLTTWQEYASGGEVISQNNALTVADPTGSGSKTGDYTTRKVALLPGSTVSANVTCSAAGFAWMYLTTNSSGTTASVAFDSYWTRIDIFAFTVPGGEIERWIGGNGSGGNFGSVAQLSSAIGQTFKLQIERPNSSSYIYRAYSSNGASLGSSTFVGAAHPEALFISLGSINGMTSTWDDVTVSGNFVVPEPASLGLLGAMAFLPARRSRRQSR